MLVHARLKSAARSSVFRYGLVSLVPRATAVITAIAVAPLAISSIGAAQYGIWVLATQIPSIVISPDLGLGQGVVTRFAETHSRDGSLASKRQDIEALTRALSVVAAIWFAVGLVASAAYTFGTSGSSLMLTALIIALACFTAGIPPTIWNQVRLAQEEGHVAVAWEGFGKVATLASCVLVLTLYPSLPLLVASYLLPATAALWAHAVYTRHKMGRGQSTSPHLKNREVWEICKPYLRVGKFFVLMQLAYVVMTASDPYLINATQGPNAVAEVNVLTRPFQVLPIVTSVLSVALWPVYVRLRTHGAIARLHRSVLITVLASLGLCTIGGATIIWAQSPVYMFLGSGELVPQTTDLVWLTALFCSVSAVAILMTYVNSALGHARAASVMVIAAPAVLAVKYVALDHASIHEFFPASTIAYSTTVLLPITVVALRSMQKEKSSSATEHSHPFDR